MAQLPATTVLVQPPGEHTSVVQDMPSLHDCVPPPAVHWPARHVIGFVQVRPEQEPVTQLDPSVAAVHDVVLADGEHVSQAFVGFFVPPG